MEGWERCVHVDKHSRSTQRKQFSGWTRKCNKAGNCGRLQLPHGLCRQGWQDGQQLSSQPSNMEVDKKNLFPPVQHDNSQQLHLTVYMWWEGKNRDFWLALVREMLARAGHEPRLPRAVGRPALASANISRLDTHHNKHWPGHNPTKRQCRVCSERGVTRTVRSKCAKCDVALCINRTCSAIIQRTHSNNYFGPSSVQIAEALTKM